MKSGEAINSFLEAQALLEAAEEARQKLAEVNSQLENPSGLDDDAMLKLKQRKEALEQALNEAEAVASSMFDD